MERPRKKWLWLDILALLVVFGSLAGVVFVLSAGDEGAEPTPFPTAAIETAEPSPSPSASSTKAPDDKVEQKLGNWPTYGFDRARTRFNPNIKLRPPFRKKWVFDPHDLFEFPPSIDDGRLYVNAGHGFVYCLDAKTGERIWRFPSKGKFASTPTIAGDLVFLTSFAGRLIVLDKYTGKMKWQFRGCTVTESSPLVWRGRVFFGDRNGDMWALSLRTHKVVWRYRCAGKVTGAPSMLNGRIVVGDYAGYVYCFNYDGGVIWKRKVGSSFGTNPFYGTPALAYNTVYIGSISSNVYALDLSNGGTRWEADTGAWVYSSPAVWQGRVYIGSFDTYFYCFDARTGREIWRFRTNGKISGSPTVLNGVVYFATLQWMTYACDARTGKLLWKWGDGKYTPVTADRERLYLCGALKIYCMVPKKK